MISLSSKSSTLLVHVLLLYEVYNLFHCPSHQFSMEYEAESDAFCSPLQFQQLCKQVTDSLCEACKAGSPILSQVSMFIVMFVLKA